MHKRKRNSQTKAEDNDGTRCTVCACSRNLPKKTFNTLHFAKQFSYFQFLNETAKSFADGAKQYCVASLCWRLDVTPAYTMVLLRLLLLLFDVIISRISTTLSVSLQSIFIPPFNPLSLTLPSLHTRQGSSHLLKHFRVRLSELVVDA